MVELNCEEIILNFQLISNYESYLPQFPKIFSFDFVEFNYAFFQEKYNYYLFCWHKWTEIIAKKEPEHEEHLPLTYFYSTNI
jgi:hypothetical protein